MVVYPICTTTTPPHGLEHLTFSTLIKHFVVAWRTNIISQILNKADSQAIQATPLLNTTSDDVLRWKFSSIEIYTVRSSYHHLMENMINNDDYKVPADWILLWQLKVPPKIKYFRGGHCSILCEYCHLENSWHVIFGCEHVIFFLYIYINARFQVCHFWLASGIWHHISDEINHGKSMNNTIFKLLCFRVFPRNSQ